MVIQKPTLKHQADIAVHCPTDCPPVDAIPRDIKAFRLVHDPLVVDDFKSHIQLRRLPKATDEIHKKCAHCGLSLYASVYRAEKHLRGQPYRSRIKYTHIAEGQILKAHGLCTNQNDTTSHFTIHEYSNVNLPPLFTVVQSIEEWKS